MRKLIEIIFPLFRIFASPTATNIGGLPVLAWLRARIVCAAVLLVASVSLAFAGWPSGGKFTPATVLTFISAQNDQTSGSTHTYSSVNIGTANSNRVLLLGIEGGYGSASEHNVSTVTVGGSSATQVGTQALGGSSQTEVAAVYAIAYPTSTSATIVITFAGTISRSTLVVWTLQRSSGGITPANYNVATNSATLSFTLGGNSGGAAVVIGGSTVSSGTYSVTTSGFTVDSTGNYSGSEGWVAGHITPTTSSNAVSTTTASITASRAALCAVSF